ncbi:MAG: hypothetical protein IKT72_00590 [Clostridia bacterium]|nr:hypothetical protein [Clostridia bacterium]
MIEPDTIKLLRECDAGVKMGIASITDVVGHVTSEELRRLLTDSRTDHETIESELRSLLDRYGDDGKAPSAIAKGMSHMKTEMKLAMDESDSTVASLMTDGCDMGVKSLSRYLNQYKAAEEDAKDIAKRLISIEDRLGSDLRAFL